MRNLILIALVLLVCGTASAFNNPNTITPTMAAANFSVANASNAQSYTKSTSMNGWYLCDDGASCFLTSELPYDVWGSKLGYNNSPNYTVVTA